VLGLMGCDSSQSEDRVGGGGQAPTFSIGPPEHDFGFTHVGTPQSQTFTIINDGEAPPDSVDEDGTMEGDVELLNSSEPERFSLERGEGSYTLAPGDSLKVEVEFDPEVDQRESTAQLKVTHNGNDEESPFLVPLQGEAVEFEGGAGTSGNPYQITRPDQLQVIDSGLRDAHFVQVGNVDASATSEWNEGDGFIPIGERTDDNRFTGTFEGSGHIISNLQIQRSSENAVGLFGGVGETVIQEVVLRDADIVGDTQVGGIVGQNEGEILRADVTGTVEGNLSVGGVAGVNFDGGTVQRAQIDGTVSGGALVGGLVGRNAEGNVFNSSVQGTVDGTGAAGQVGGLVGRNTEGDIRRSMANADVSSSGERGQVGGLVGRNVGGVIRESEYVNGSVEGQVSAGGLVGANFSGGVIREAVASGTVLSDDRGGGLVGRNAVEGTILNSQTTAEVQSERNAGGLVGLNRDSVRGSWAEGDVRGTENVGGLIGANLGTVQASYAQGTVDGDMRVGGLVGRSNEGSLRQSYTVGSVSGSSSVGALVGRQKGGVVATSYWNTNTTTQSQAVGLRKDTSVDAAGLTEREMTGTEARQNMDGFDFEDTWTVVTDGYPALQWENR